ncbi:MAG: acyl-CoA dehydrogenase family protein [Alphaproteobacteria bacterium]|jgi:3-hydroxy-9,10-secoandrosta-1,3,5(10)-triene-9,17-dione monooxygenase
MGGLETNISRDEILKRASDMVPVLQERARDAELARRIPEETDQAFRDAGFYRVLQPARFGGLELDFGTQTELAIKLSPGCASSGWVAAVTACHGWLLGMFPPKAQEDVWGKNPEASIASSFLGFGPTIERVEGGLHIDGRWGFSSGVNHCSWVVLQVAVPPEKEGDRPQLHFALVPLDECEIVDTWQTTGLAATGSNDLVLKDVFVPDYRTVDFMALRGGPTPGSEVNPGYLYSLPQRATFSFNLVGSVIGSANGTVQMLIEEMKKRVTVGGANLQELSTVRYRIAEAESEVAAAYSLMDRNRAEIIAKGKAGDIPTIEDRARYRRDNGYATKLCVQAVDRIYPIMGGRGIVSGNAVNRAWRDVHAISHHIALTWDVVASTAASLAVGGPNDDPLL